MGLEQEFAKMAALQERHRKYHKLEYYKPYAFQRDFHNALGHRTNRPAVQKVLQAGNGTGKTVCGAMDTAFHLTGRYPEWWRGHRYRHPPLFMVGGNTNEAVLNICQKALFGDPNEPQALGSGSVPIDCIGKRTGKTGVPNAFDAVLVKHISGGWSKVLFRAYEQGPRKHMGYRIDGGWCDEEPPQEIWSQYLRATISTGGVLIITYTPETGLTEVVNGFMNNLQRGQALVMAEWKDAPHLVQDGQLSEAAKQLAESFPPHEREMRMKGVPTYGRGLVFPFTDEQIMVDPIPIPRHWPRIIGIDFGWDHPFAACMLAWDRDADVIYVTAEYAESRATPPIHASAIKPWGQWPIAWPHDGLNTEKGTGDELRQKYINEGLDLLPEKATNPPQAGQEEGDGGTSVEAAILEMYERMDSGRWKVFKTCPKWRQESRIYHRDENMKLVKVRDDLLSASRYACMMRRWARVEIVRKRKAEMALGVSNW